MITYDINALKELLHLGKKQAEALMKTEGFPSVHIGRNWIVEESALKQWLDNTKSIKLDYSKL